MKHHLVIREELGEKATAEQQVTSKSYFTRVPQTADL